MQKHRLNLDHIKQGLTIEIVANIDGTLFQKSDAIQNNEAEYQIVEGCFYQYKLSLSNCSLNGSHNVVEASSFNPSEGRISPNFYVGTLSIPILEQDNEIGIFKLEVQSIKTSYRKDYRYMLESITNYATDLVLQTSSPVSQTFEVDHKKDTKTLYQKFCFVKSIVETDDFDLAIQQITQSPVTSWTTKTENVDVRSLKKLNSRDVRNLISSQNRIKVPSNHSLQKKHGIKSIALKIPTSMKIETVNTVENRFIKYVLETFLQFCEDIQIKSSSESRLNQEAQITANYLQVYLNHNLFKEVSRLTLLKFDSPILQKKTGYRRVLKTWLMYDLAAKLTWKGGEDVYSAGNKNIAKLYEYWLFFKLLEAVKETFDIRSEEYQKLIAETDDGLGLQLKEGKEIALNGYYLSKERELAIQFSYNKSFGSNTELSKEGSWTLGIKPDYTLSIWPKELEKNIAEEREQIVHIHFDAKYKVKNKKDNPKFKPEDVIKMHAYKDAIRRTGGAYILYPGTEKKPTTFKGFHEILPGLGAFAIRPVEDNDGTEHLIDFIKQIKNHFLNRVTQRENLSSKTYQITKDLPNDSIHEPMPEYLNNKKLIPDETYVLVGFTNTKKKMNWFEEHRLYNFRMNDEKGSLVFETEIVNAKFLLIRESGKSQASKLFKIAGGIRVFSKERLTELDHPDATKDHYLVYGFEKECTEIKDFKNARWNFKELESYKKKVEGKNIRYAAGLPFATTLTKLMATKSK